MVLAPSLIESGKIISVAFDRPFERSPKYVDAVWNAVANKDKDTPFLQ